MMSNHIAIELVLSIRNTLCNEFIVDDGANRDYRGLCDNAHNLLVEKINSYNVDNGTEYVVDCYHGEQKHTLGMIPKYWQYQHTWSSISDRDGSNKIFIDSTCQQFQWLYDDIPDYYISTEPPKWFYWDEDNPYFKWKNKIIRKIIYVGQYYFWWHLSEFVRVWKMRSRKERSK